MVVLFVAQARKIIYLVIQFASPFPVLIHERAPNA
jgi:hypothetical protein